MIAHSDDLYAHPVQLKFMPDLYGPSYSRLECSTAVGQIEAVRSGAGIGILHDYAAVRDDRLRPVLPEIKFERSYWIVMHEDLRGVARVRAGIDYLVEQVSASGDVFKLGVGT